jgi:hypothetical protein
MLVQVYWRLSMPGRPTAGAAGIRSPAIWSTAIGSTAGVDLARRRAAPLRPIVHVTRPEAPGSSATAASLPVLNVRKLSVASSYRACARGGELVTSTSGLEGLVVGARFPDGFEHPFNGIAEFSCRQLSGARSVAPRWPDVRGVGIAYPLVWSTQCSTSVLYCSLATCETALKKSWPKSRLWAKAMRVTCVRWRRVTKNWRNGSNNSSTRIRAYLSGDPDPSGRAPLGESRRLAETRVMAEGGRCAPRYGPGRAPRCR